MSGRAGVVGHHEWLELAELPHLPARGEIVDARALTEVPGGGGGVAAVQLARMGGPALFFTALGSDAIGDRAERELGAALGDGLHAARRAGPTRRAFALLDDAGERTIVVLGDRLAPEGADDLPWGALADLDAVYLTAGDAGAVRAARAARVLVATSRAADGLTAAGVRADVLVASAGDAREMVLAGALRPAPRALVVTDGERGGTWREEGGPERRWDPAPPPGPHVDTFGAGDTFAGAITHALARGATLQDAIAFAARCGAAVVTGRGPYGAELPPM